MNVLWLWVIYILILIIAYAILSSFSFCSSWSKGIIFFAATLLAALVVLFIYMYTDKSVYKNNQLFWYNALLVLAIILPFIAIIYIIVTNKVKTFESKDGMQKPETSSRFKRYMKYDSSTDEYRLIKETIYEGENETTIDYE